MPTQTDEQAIAEQAVTKMEAEHASFSAAHLAVTRMQLEQMDRTGCYRDLNGIWHFPRWAKTKEQKHIAMDIFLRNASDSEKFAMWSNSALEK